MTGELDEMAYEAVHCPGRARDLCMADFGVQDLGTVTLPEPVNYHAAEIRALLRSRTARG